MLIFLAFNIFTNNAILFYLDKLTNKKRNILNQYTIKVRILQLYNGENMIPDEITIYSDVHLVIDQQAKLNFYIA